MQSLQQQPVLNTSDFQVRPPGLAEAFFRVRNHRPDDRCVEGKYNGVWLYRPASIPLNEVYTSQRGLGWKGLPTFDLRLTAAVNISAYPSLS